jgi:hypothetical protein
MRTHALMLVASLAACSAAAAQPRDPDDGYWGPRDPVNQSTFSQRWPAQPLATAPRLDAEGYDMGKPAPPETTGRGQSQEAAKPPPQPRNSPDPNPLPGEEPRPIPK